MIGFDVVINLITLRKKMVLASPMRECDTGKTSLQWKSVQLGFKT